jgi:COMPASS component SWD1
MEIAGRIVSFVWGHQILVVTSDFKLYSFDTISGMLWSESAIDAPEDDALVAIHPCDKTDSCLVVFRSGLVLLFDVTAGTQIAIRASTTDTNVTCSAFHESGILYLGLSKDLLIVVNTHTRQDVPLEGGAAFGANCVVQRIAIHPMQKQVSFVLKDKTIRVASLLYENDAIRIEPRHKLQDAVNRWLWNICGFSHDGELIWGSFCTPGEHLIYMWDSNSGALVKMLQGPKEDLVLAAWNPKGPSIITGAFYGALYRWVPEYPVKWSALVPGLEEIEENVEYIERENEFDMVLRLSMH